MLGYMNKSLSRGNEVMEESPPWMWVALSLDLGIELNKKGKGEKLSEQWCYPVSASWPSQMWVRSLLPPQLLIYGPCPGDCTSGWVTRSLFSLQLLFVGVLKTAMRKVADQIICVKHLVLCASRRWGSECQTSGGSQDPETWISWDFLGDLLGIWLFLTFARWNVQSCLLITPGWLGLCHCFISTWRVPSVNFSSHWRQ